MNGQATHHFETIEIGSEDLPEGCFVLDFYSYWESIRDRAEFPPKGALDPLDMPTWVLPWLFLLEIDRSGGEVAFFFRLVGTKNVDLVGRDPTGKYVSEVFLPEVGSVVISAFEATLEKAAPTFWQSTVPHDIIGKTTL